MATDGPEAAGGWERLVAPNALLAGAVASFLGCCLAGHQAGRHDPFGPVERFHAFLTPENLFYPTPRLVRASARARLDPGRVAVVVGGSSRLHGTGQPELAVWTRRLQAELGEQFRVLNFAVRSGHTAEFGLAVAEMLYREHPRLIFVTDVHPGGGMSPRPDGDRYRYFYWEARSRGLLLPAPRRDALLQEFPQGEEAGGHAERQRGLWLDRACAFSDLWNWAAYRHFSTLWTPDTGKWFFRPRRAFADPDEGPAPPQERFRRRPPSELEQFRELLRCAKVARDGTGDWAEEPGSPWWALYHRTLRGSFPDVLRGHVIVLVPRISPYHLGRLSPEDRLSYAGVCRATVRATESEGLAALEVGATFSEKDYADLLHFAPSGGDKLAVQVAAQVRRRAWALGLLPETQEVDPCATWRPSSPRFID
jgi:hypothetical protein